MFYSVFFRLKGSDEVKKILNFKSKEEILEKIFLPLYEDNFFIFEDEKIEKDNLHFIKVIETGSLATDDYESIKRYIKETKALGEKFLNEKFPNYYAKDITDDLKKEK